MKLKLGENIPHSAAARLAALGYDVDTVLDEQRSKRRGLVGCGSGGRFLVTHDQDFSDARKFESGQHAGVLIRGAVGKMATCLERLSVLDEAASPSPSTKRKRPGSEMLGCDGQCRALGSRLRQAPSR